MKGYIHHVKSYISLQVLIYSDHSCTSILYPPYYHILYNGAELNNIVFTNYLIAIITLNY